MRLWTDLARLHFSQFHQLEDLSTDRVGVELNATIADQLLSDHIFVYKPESAKQFMYVPWLSGLISKLLLVFFLVPNGNFRYYTESRRDSSRDPNVFQESHPYTYYRPPIKAPSVRRVATYSVFGIMSGLRRRVNRLDNRVSSTNTIKAANNNHGQ